MQQVPVVLKVRAISVTDAGTVGDVVRQEVRGEVLSGDAPREITFINDYHPLTAGDTLYVTGQVDQSSGSYVYTAHDPYRVDVLLGLVVVFCVIVAWLGGKQGVRGLVALGLSIGAVFYGLVPLILSGADALVSSLAVAAGIVVVGSYITHGFSRVTSAAVAGMLLALVSTGAMLALVAPLLKLTGLDVDEAVYLKASTSVPIDFVGLLIGSMLIGFLGVLYDAAIGQSAAVDELYASNPTLSARDAYRRALRIGREHIGALVNTLAIAYVGVAMPLILLFAASAAETPLLFILNRELFAVELVRMCIGGIGVVAVVPLTTAIAVRWLKDDPNRASRAGQHAHHHGAH